MSTDVGWLLAAVTAVLAALVVVLALAVLRLRSRLAHVEGVLEDRRLPASATAPSAQPRYDAAAPLHMDVPTAEYLITRVGEPEVEEPSPVGTVPGPVFADMLLKESVVQTASLLHGLRRALAPETRNRIRFHMRQEVKRSRKQRRTELREVRREWAARQRSGMAAEEGSAA